MPVEGSRIRERRLALGLSQQQLGGKALTRSFVSLLEQGKAQPSRQTLELIANRLDKPPEYFLTEERGGDSEALALLEKATNRYIAAKQWTEAAEHAESALRLAERMGKPEVRLRIRMQLALCQLFSRKYELALEIYETVIDECKALNDRERLAEAYFRRATASHVMEDYLSARRSYMVAIRLTADKKSQVEIHAAALINLGSCYAIMGQLEEAIQVYEQATEVILPSEYPGCFANACLGLSVSMSRLSRWKEALYYGEKARRTLEQVDPQNALDARLNVCTIQAEFGDVEGALEQIKECLELYRQTGKVTRQAWALGGLALCYLKLGQMEKVKQHCEEALNLLDLHDDGLLRGVLYRRLAEARFALGEPERARELLRFSINILRRVRAYDRLEETTRLLENWGISEQPKQ